MGRGSDQLIRRAHVEAEHPAWMVSADGGRDIESDRARRIHGKTIQRKTYRGGQALGSVGPDRRSKASALGFLGKPKHLPHRVHISPWAATLGLVGGAARLLEPRTPLILYGACVDPEVPIADSNRAFDASLRARDFGCGASTFLVREGAH